MNIHFIGPEKVSTAQYRARTGERKATNKGTEPAKTRPGQEYPGGRQMRKAMRALGRRQNAHASLMNSSGGKGKSINPQAFQKPGSMKARAR